MIQPMSMAVERIYSSIQDSSIRSLAITSANAGEGVTSVATALAHRSLLGGHSTLLIDLNVNRPALTGMLDIPRPPSKITLFQQPHLVTIPEQSVVLTGITAPTQRDAITKLRTHGILEQCIANWQQQFDQIIIDCSPVHNATATTHFIPPERVAAACDSSLLVVLAGHSTEAMVEAAAKKIRSGGAELLGCVFNDRDNPPLKNELLRELCRFPGIFRAITDRISKRLNNNHLLSVEV